MREYLKRLARGNFIYDDIGLSFETDDIKLDVTRGKIAHFDITFKSSEYIKGVIWSSNPRVKVENQVFSGKQMKINYTVDANVAESLEDIEEYITGSFDIVCNACEAHIPYSFRLVSPKVSTTLGLMGQMYDFATLVQSQTDEARALFKKDEFKDVFIDDCVLSNIYDMLKEQENTSRAVEELLVSAHMKLSVNIQVDETQKNFENFSESIKDIIVIDKSGWGYTCIEVLKDQPFIKINNNVITADDFTGNRFELEYFLDKSKMHKGLNCGVISLKTHNQVIKINISVNCGSMDRTRKDIRTALYKLSVLYLDYRRKVISVGEWVEKSTQVLDRVRGLDNDNAYFKLLQAQLFLIQKREMEGISILENVKKELSMMPHFSEDASRFDREYSVHSVEQVHLYCFYLYVNSLALKDEAYTAKAAAIIKNYYENGYDTWRLLWLLFYLDNSYTKNISIKLLRIKETCHKGCTSPIMYMEAIQLMNEQPSLLRVFDIFEIQVIRFGCKYNLISEKLADQISTVIGTLKVASKEMVSVLAGVYNLYEKDEILLNLVTQLIRNELFGEEYFALYEKGILRGIKITRLYEYYIKSIGKKQIRLPKLVLMYFAYDSLMNYKDKAYLLAHVICNETANEEIMKHYQPQIEKFAYEQLKAGRFSDNLNIIYKYVWKQAFISDETADNMIKFMFTYKVTSFDSRISRVIVKHKELNTTTEYMVENGVAFIQMYTNEAAFVFEDENKKRYKNSIGYELERVFDDTSLIDELIKYNNDNELFDMYLFENNMAVMPDEQATYELALKFKKNDNLSLYQRRSLNTWLICYYDAYYIGNDFNEALNNIDTTKLPSSEAAKVIEMCITHDCYDEAYQLINEYGLENVSTTSIFRFVRNMLERVNIGEDGLIISACDYIFADKKYNEEVLKYMVVYYNNTTDKMYDLWKACQNFGTPCTELEERIIAQMLFTSQHNGRMTEVFGSYYNSNGRKFIILAYISYHSDLYFVKGARTNDIVFKVIEKLVYDDEEVLDVCKLALLKYYSVHVDTLSINQILIATRLVEQMCKEDKCFEFFKKFGEVMKLPYNLIGKTCLEHRANPDAKVEIHYYYGDNSDNEYTQVMNNCCGVFVNSFLMFYGDTINYYFTEDYNGQITKTKTFNYHHNTINMNVSENRYDCINDVLASKESHDTVTMKKLMHGYVVKDYVTNELFKPMN